MSDDNNSNNFKIKEPVKFYSGYNRSSPIYFSYKGVTVDISSRKELFDQSGSPIVSSYGDILDFRHFKDITKVLQPSLNDI